MGRFRAWARNLLPLVVSAALLAWLVWRVPLPELAAAFRQLAWRPLVAITVALVVLAFFWDSLCIWSLFNDRDRPLKYRTALRARGSTYLFFILNFGLGQGLLAWIVAKAQGRPLLTTAGRCAAMACVDAGVLLALGLVGATISEDPRTDGVAVFCGIALGGLTSFALILSILPTGMTRRLQQTRLGAEILSAGLSRRRLASLVLLRLTYYMFMMTHASTLLWLGGIPLDFTVVLSVIPIMALVDGLPISFTGLGTREAVLLTLLQPEQPAILLACMLVWWAVMVLGRAAIGMAVVGLSQLRALAIAQ